MDITIKTTPDLERLMVRLGDDFEGGMSAAMQYLVSDIEARALDHVPVRTSNLYNSITSYISDRGMTGVVKATARNAKGEPYGKYVHDGTGIYGPHKKKIVPTDKKALFWPGARHPVRSVRGMRPRPFFTKAIKEANPQKLFEEGLMNYLRRRGW